MERRLSVHVARESWQRRAHYLLGMPVTAKFVPEHIEMMPNVTTTSTLRLYNDDAETRAVVLSVAGDFGNHARLEATTATIETNQIVDVAVTLFAPSTVEAGGYSIGAEVGSAPRAQPEQAEQSDFRVSDHPAEALVVATASVEVVAHSDYILALQPAFSRGSRRGRHVVRVANTGNVPLVLTVGAEPTDGGLDVEIGRAALTVGPGAAADVPITVTPAVTYWSGPTQEYEFTLRATSGEGRSDELVGVFRQPPRVPNWVGPAAAGALAALLIGAIVWFAFLRPWVQDTADDAAADAIEQDRAALRERIAELETAAAEAQELPLGVPIDFRLDVDPASGDTQQAAATIAAGTVVSITDVVFQNPTGAVGTVTLRRGDDVLLQSELANFRDFDLHFVAPFQFGDDVEIVLDVECRTPGSGAGTCPVAASLVGFVDETD
jgi:hypothetical protein